MCFECFVHVCVSNVLYFEMYVFRMFCTLKLIRFDSEFIFHLGGRKRQEKRQDKMHVFEAKIASRGYHVFMNTTWTRAFVGEHINVEIETNRESIRRDPYACAIRKTNRCFANVSETVGHIPRELSRHVFHFILFERGSVSGTVVSTQYCPSPSRWA